jgi:hypothetical protein
MRRLQSRARAAGGESVNDNRLTRCDGPGCLGGPLPDEDEGELMLRLLYHQPEPDYGQGRAIQRALELQRRGLSTIGLPLFTRYF